MFRFTLSCRGFRLVCIDDSRKSFDAGNAFSSAHRVREHMRLLIQLSPCSCRWRTDGHSKTLMILLIFALSFALVTGTTRAQTTSRASFETATHHVTDSKRETPTVLAVRRASPSVVNLHGQKTVRSTASNSVGAGDSGGFRQVNGMGTGIIIDPRGYVITNYHVVEDVDNIRVTLHDGTVTSAQV